MKCPHCLVAFHDDPSPFLIGTDKEGEWQIIQRTCPNCYLLVLHLAKVHRNGPFSSIQESLIRPKSISRTPLPPEIPEKFTNDYKEACLVLVDSPKASAALSRRCLQHLLRSKANIKKGDLADEIQQVIESGKLPSHLSESLDAIRHIGNFAAHPIKSKTSGEIVEVEPGEAEWNLDVLESLFDFYFVQPSILQKKRESLNKKLTDAGKPPMK